METQIINQHLLITGGSGFLGKHICRLASQEQIPVISISRLGKPDKTEATAYKNVEWIGADIFNPDSWKRYLTNCFAVIHTIGIIEENISKGITYEKMIFQAAKIVGEEATRAGIKKFVYISAGGSAPETPKAYMENKTAAEDFLSSLSFSLATLKPGMLYGQEQPWTIQENEALQKLLQDPHIGPHLKPNRPLPVETVAAVALQAALSDGLQGKLSVDEIEQIHRNVNSYQNR